MPKLRLLSLPLVLLAAALPSAAQAEEPPLLSFSPLPLDLGKATVGTETGAAAVDVVNVSGAGLSIDSTQLTGADPGDFKLTGSSCGWLSPDQHCTVWVSFAPGSLGAREATLSLVPKEAPEQALPLSGTGAAPQLSISPGSYDFGIVPTNQGGGSAWFQLTNSGEAFVQLGSVWTAGADSGNFWTSGGDCWSGRRLEPGESCSQQVTFNAWDAVSYEAELRAEANGTSFATTLTGTGGRAMLEPASNPVDLGSAPVGTTGKAQAIVLTNNGNIAGNFFIAVIAGGDVGSFQIVDESCTLEAVAPGATCTVHVRFSPQSVGGRVARLALFGEGDGGTMVALRGEGLEPVADPVVSVSTGSARASAGDAAPAAAPSAATAAPVRPRKRPRHRRFARGDAIGPPFSPRPQRRSKSAGSAVRASALLR